jgi:hypothetical protein
VNKGVQLSSIDGVAGSYLSSARIFQPHAVTYLVGIILYVVLYIVANVFLTICGNNACPGFCCCCCSGKGRKQLQTFSNNIYTDLSVEDLKSEYTKAKTELSDFRVMVERGMITS